MSGVELTLVMGSVLLAILAVFFVAYVVKISGRDRPRDPERVKRFVQNAPLERLALVLNDYDVGTDTPKAP